MRRERRRRRTVEDKLRIVREMLEPGAAALRVGERHEISTGLLFTWRRPMMATALSRQFLVLVRSQGTGSAARSYCGQTSAGEVVVLSTELSLTIGAKL